MKYPSYLAGMERLRLQQWHYGKDIGLCAAAKDVFSTESVWRYSENLQTGWAGNQGGTKVFC
jgi:hypothetical protein